MVASRHIDFVGGPVHKAVTAGSIVVATPAAGAAGVTEDDHVLYADGNDTLVPPPGA